MVLPTRKIDANSISSHGGTDYLNTLAGWTGKGSFVPKQIKEVLNYLGNPQDKINAIHIGGTNGKGSVSAMISAILGAEGYSVGLSTSPHLTKVNERVVINGRAIRNEELSYFSSILEELEGKKGIKLSYHEALTAISFMAFHESALDWMVIEVGLGGRLDSTNVMASPKAVAITSISYDHEEQLGNTLALICKEKCGIFRRNVPVVTGFLPLEAKEVLQREAASYDCKVSAYKKDFDCWEENGSKFFRYPGGVFELTPSLRGSYQLENIGVSCQLGKLLGISDGSIQKGVEEVFWPARFEKIKYKNKLFIVDAAHNGAGGEALAKSLKDSNINRLDLIFSSLTYKNWEQTLSPLLPFTRNVYFLRANSESSITFESFTSFVSCSGISPVNYDLNYEGLIEDVLGEIPILATGSIYMVGGLRELLKADDRTEPQIWKRKETA